MRRRGALAHAGHCALDLIARADFHRSGSWFVRSGSGKNRPGGATAKRERQRRIWGGRDGYKHVMDAFRKRPAMSQIYSAYLARFLDTPKVGKFLVDLLAEETLADWQRMWVLAALLQIQPNNNEATKIAAKILKDANRHDALRAVAAIYISRYGDLDRRKALTTLYPNVSSYIQSAIYYSSRYWHGVEKSNAKANWGNHGALNTLLTVALGKKD